MTIKEAFEKLTATCSAGMKNPFFIMRNLHDTFADIADKIEGGGGGGSTVEVTQVVSSGTKIATITVDDTPTDIYAPAGGGSDTYSTTEHKVGTWTDDSDLYEVTIIYNAEDNSNYQNVVEFPITNEVKEVKAVFESATHESIPGLWAGSIFWQWGIAIAADTKRYVMVKRNTADANWKTATLIMTIRYTKSV